MSPGPNKRPWMPDSSHLELWALTAIVLVAALLRLPALEQTPPGPFADEAAIATTAYALGTTGRDLVGTPLPLYSEQRSFERWGQHDIITQPVFQYWSVPFVLFGGLDLFWLRLAAVCLGLLAIPGTFLLGASLFGRHVGLAGALMLAISPWHMHFSRVGFEAIALPTLLAYGAWLIQRGLSHVGSAVAGTLLLALASYAYPVALVFVPLLVVAFALSQRVALLARWRVALACAALLAVLQIPNLASMTQRGRAADVSIASAELTGEAAMQFLEARSDSAWSQAIQERRGLLLPFVFAYNYASYLGPDFLYLEGDPNPRHGTGNGGVAYRFTAPLLLLGLFVLLRKAREAHSQFALGWLLAFPIGASLTTEGPHAIRAIVALPMLPIVCGIGAIELLRLATQAAGQPARRVAASAVALAVLVAVPFEAANRLRHYHGQYRIDSAAWWQAGVGAAILEADTRRGQYDRLLVSGSIFNAYSFLLMFGQVDIAALSTELDLNGQLAPFDYRVLFYDEQNELDATSHDLVLLSARDDVADLVWRPVAEFPFPDGRPHLRLIEIGPALRPDH